MSMTFHILLSFGGLEFVHELLGVTSPWIPAVDHPVDDGAGNIGTALPETWCVYLRKLLVGCQGNLT